MKKFVRSVPAILITSAASLSMVALAGCGSSGHHGLKGAQSIYAITNTYNETTDIEQDSVAVFSASAKGSASPTSTLALPSDFYGYSLAIGPQGQIYVGGTQYSPDDEDVENGEILEYAAGASGTASPTVTLNSAENSFNYPDSLAVNSAGTLFVSSEDYTIEAFASGFTATSSPIQYLTWGTENFEDYGDYLAADTAGDIFYMDSEAGEDEDGAIYVFAAGATGATAPVRTITGTDTAPFYELKGIAADGAGDVYVANYNESDDPNGNDNPGVNPGTFAANKRATGPHGAAHLAAHSHLTAHPHTGDTYEHTGIIEFAAGAASTPSSNPTPVKRIGAAGATPNNTNISEPDALAVDAASNVYYADGNGGWYSETNPSELLEVFPASATGNVAPAASITSTSLTSENVSAIAVK